MNEQSIFEAVLAIDEPTERSAFLDRACAGAAALRAQVEKLLQEHERSSGDTARPGRSNPAREQATPGQLADTIDETPAGHETLAFLLPADKPNVLGRLDHYEILEIIGKGGMGMVLRAFDGRLHRMVAIKVMATHLAINATARKRFGREARTAAAVTHDHIVTIHAVEETRALPYLVMKYVPGVSLQQRLRDGPLPLEDIVRIGMETASGLAAAHAKGLIHRDIKPANILLETRTLPSPLSPGERGRGEGAGPNSGNSTATLLPGAQSSSTGAFRVKITDFGLARAADDSSLTQTGVVAGTPDYMSPEQARGERVDARTDLFSLGSVLYFMCTRSTPFHADETLAILSRVCEETPTPIRQINPEIPDWLAAIIEKLHAKDPAKRFQSAGEVAEVLGLHLARLRNPAPVNPVANVPEDAGERKRPPRRRPPRRRRWAIIASLVLLLGGLSLMVIGVMNIADFFRPVGPGDDMRVAQPADPAPDVDLVARGQGYSEAAQWDKAAADFAKAIEQGSEDIERVWYPLALLHLRAGRTTEYRALCERLLKLSPEPKYTYRVLIICKLGPDAVADFAPLVRLAEALVAPNPNNAEYVGLLGHTLHRKGDWQAAAERLEAANRMDTGLGAPWRRLMLAMTYHRLGRATEAAYHFGEVSEWMEKNAGPKLGAGAELKQPLPWEFRLDLELLRRETAQLLNIEPGWVQLFNGKDLTGWKYHPDQTGGWTVEEGHLVGRSKLVHHLFSERGVYEDFHLRAEVQVNKDGNSGIYFRARFALEPQYQNLPFPLGYEAQILNSYPRPAAHMTGSIFGLAKGGKSPVAPETWFTLDIIARGDNLVVKVNDQVTAQASDKTHRRGHLVLQAMSDVGSVDQTTIVRFRKIEIKELPREEPGWVQLFNGKDLAGWKTQPERAGNWTVENGELVGRGNGTRLLTTERADYENFHFRVEVKINQAGESGQYFRTQAWSTGYEAQISMSNTPSGKTGTLSRFQGKSWSTVHRVNRQHVPADTWFVQEVIADGAHLVVKINGETVADVFDSTYTRGNVALEAMGADTVVHFRKIEIKELPPTGAAWVQLFNGKDLTGWKPHPNWKVKDGILIGSGPTERNAMLATERNDYEDFHLRVEVLIPTEDCDSGVLFRSWSDRSSNSVQEANIAFHPKKLDEQTGTLSLQKYEAGKWAGGRRFPGPPGLGKLNEWVTLEIIARGPHVITKVNGSTAVDTHEAVGHRPSHISLQQNGAQTVVHFRKVEIKELVARPDQVVELAEKALEKDPDSGAFLANLGAAYYRAGRWNEAIRTLLKANEAGRGADVSFRPFDLAMAHRQAGDLAKARQWYDLGLVWLARQAAPGEELRRVRAEAALLLGVSEQSEQLSAELDQAKSDSLKYLDLVVKAHPEAIWAYEHRSRAHAAQQHWPEAQADLRSALGLLDKNAASDLPTRLKQTGPLIQAQLDLGALLLKANEKKAAAAAYALVVTIEEKLQTQFAGKAEQLAKSHVKVAGQLKQAGQPQEAEKLYRWAVKHFEKLFEERPEDVRIRRELAWRHQDLAEVLLYQLNQLEEAAKSRQRQVALFEQLVKDSPTDPVNREHVGHSLRWLAFDFQKMQQPAPAEEALGQAIEHLKKLTGDSPDKTSYCDLLADTYDRLHKHLAANGKAKEANEAFDHGIRVLASFPAERATTPAERASLADLHHRRGNLLRGAKRLDEAAKAYRQAIDLRGDLAAKHPTERAHRQELGRNHNWLGIVLTQNGKPQDAEQAHRDAFRIYEKLAEETAPLAASVSRNHRRELAWTCLKLGAAVEKAGRFDEAMERYRQAGELCEKLGKEYPADGAYPQWERQGYGKLIQLLTGAGRPQEAKDICRKLLERQPPLSGQALNVLAWNLVAGDDPKSWAPEAAVELARKAVELLPKSADCWNTLGVAHYRAGDWQAAISELRKSDALEGPNFFELNAFFLAMAHWQQEEKEQARKWYAAALAWMEKRNSKVEVVLRSRKEAASLLGLDEKLSKEQEQAKADDVKLCTLVIEANPESAWAYNHRGRAYGRAKEWDKAFADFSRAIDLKPAYWLNWADRAWIRKYLKQPNEALADCSKAVELGANMDWVWRQRGEIHGELGQWDKALADYSKVIALKPTVAPHWMSRGNCFAELGQWDKAAVDFEKAQELAADDPLPRFRLALLRLQAGDREGYRKICAAMLERFSSKGVSDASYWTAWTCMLGPDAVTDWQPVINLVEKIVAPDPKNCDKLQLLGGLLHRAGRFEDALKRLAEAEAAFPEAKNPRSTIVYCWLFQSMSLRRLGQSDEAKKRFDKAAQAIDEPPATSKDANAGLWNRRLTLQLLRREVETQRGKD